MAASKKEKSSNLLELYSVYAGTWRQAASDRISESFDVEKMKSRFLDESIKNKFRLQKS